MKFLLIFLIRVYQAVHLAFFRGSCRFYPTCSQYAVEALESHGALKGAWLALRRFVRCQPFCRGGFDPVPPGPHDLRRAESRLHTSLPRGWGLRVSAASRP